MASTSIQEESCSSLLPRDYEVFLSFRGEDTRKNFTDHLYAALDRHRIYTFRDDKLMRGEEIGPEVLKAIEGSKISVIVFSRNYADSEWCLDELVKILECKHTAKQVVLPVFYDVDPSEVCKQEGGVGKAFTRLEERFKGGGMEGKLEEWRAALTEAANLSGWNLQNLANGYESKFIEMIVVDISKKLNLPYLNVASHPVGLQSRVSRVNKLLRLGPNNVHMVGIWGIGGLGKTTIAKAVYNQIYLKFEGRSFLADVRENSKQPSGLVKLQKRLLSNILMYELSDITNVDHGIEVIKKKLQHRRVLLVLDDVDDKEQLRALAIWPDWHDWFHSGSRIIVTTRDKHLLNILKVDGFYMPESLNHKESLLLFSWHAFGENHITEDYVELSKKVVGYAGGLPLALGVLGSSLFGKKMPEWENALEKLKVIPHEEIQEKLRISYDSLSDDLKDLFLDIACFFVGMDKNYTIEILKGCGFFPVIDIGNLSHRCLVIDVSDQLMMHDMIRDMGREIVRNEHRKEPGKRSRLWNHEEVLNVLTEHTGTEAVTGLTLNSPRSDVIRVNAQALAKMDKLKLLELNYVHLSGSYEHISKRLKWLCWFEFPEKSLPSNLFIDNVVAIDMRHSKLKQVWKGRKILKKLKFLNLSHSKHLTKTPDFSGCTSLEKLLLNDCTSLVKVHPSIECLDKLVVLNLENCKNLRKLPLGILKLTSLQDLSFSGYTNLEKLLGTNNLASPMRNPDSIRHSLVSISGLISIKILRLADCNLSKIPDELGSLISLKELHLKGNNFCTLPASISHLSRLEELYVSHCTRLRSLPRLPVNLKNVVARHCTRLRSLERLTIGSNFRLYPNLDFSCSHKLDESDIESYFRKCILQDKELSGDLWKLGAGGSEGSGGSEEHSSIIVPGSRVPDYFNYQSEGPVLILQVPLLPDQKIQGWTLCVVASDTGIQFRPRRFCFRGTKTEIRLSSAFWSPFSYEFKNYTKGIGKKYGLTHNEFLPYHQDHVYLHHSPKACHELQIDGGDEIEFSVRTSMYSIIEVKEIGVKLIYEDSENDQAVVVRQSFIRKSETTATSSAAARGTSGKRKRAIT